MKTLNNIEDFLCHPEFVRWVKQPDKELDSYWEQWIKANPELFPTMRLAREMLLRTSFNTPLSPVGFKQQVLQEVLRQREKKAKQPVADKKEKKKFGYRNFWNGLGQMNRVAAILLFSLGMGGLFSPINKMNSLVEEEIEEAATVLKRTGAGEKLQLTLGDGTKVWLNSSSQLEFPKKFSNNERSLHLIGEAYFEVKRDSLRPFKVNTDGLMTTVLGTSFNINTKVLGKIKVSLVSGKVEVSSSETNTPLLPGEMLDYDGLKETHTIGAFDVAKVLAWKEGVLRFQKSTLPQVKAALEEWFGVKIKLQNANGVTWEFSGTYPQQTLEEVLESMSYIKGFDYRINGKEAIIKF
ncbi:FecR domain-containing protein [uncultured Cyclobacterium sp.]|uniref:FecR family protein n=1 Tax=uncultured Cyclobacterium sp. TaxID=453820 RepID=UPI0030ECA8DA